MKGLLQSKAHWGVESKTFILYSFSLGLWDCEITLVPNSIADFFLAFPNDLAGLVPLLSFLSSSGTL